MSSYTKCCIKFFLPKIIDGIGQNAPKRIKFQNDYVVKTQNAYQTEHSKIGIKYNRFLKKKKFQSAIV